MGIIDTLFRRFKALAAAADKAQVDLNAAKADPTASPTKREPLADSVLKIQKMNRQRPEP